MLNFLKFTQEVAMAKNKLKVMLTILSTISRVSITTAANVEKNNFQVKTDKFFIDSKSVLTGASGAATLMAAGLLIKYLFFNEVKNCVNLLIEVLKVRKVAKIYLIFNDQVGAFFFDCQNNLISIEDSLYNKDVEKLMGIKNNTNFDERAKIRFDFSKRLSIGLEFFKQSVNGLMSNFLLNKKKGPHNEVFRMDKNGKIIMWELNKEQWKKEQEEKIKKSSGAEKYMQEKTLKLIMDIFENEVIKKVLTAAYEQGIYGRADYNGINTNKILEGDIKSLNNISGIAKKDRYFLRQRRRK